MLSLSRKTGERYVITIPPSETPTTIEIEQGKSDRRGSRLGFEAPLAVKIQRKEIADAQRDAGEEGRAA